MSGIWVLALAYRPLGAVETGRPLAVAVISLISSTTFLVGSSVGTTVGPISIFIVVPRHCDAPQIAALTAPVSKNNTTTHLFPTL